MTPKRIPKITAVIILISTHICTPIQSLAQEIKKNTLSPSLNISDPLIKMSLKNLSKPQDSSDFLTRRPENWRARRPRQWPKRTYNEPESALEAIAEQRMTYPKHLLNRPDMFDQLDKTDPGIAFDMEHYEFNYDTGYWHSKDFPQLVLGTWQDVEKIFPDKQRGHSRSKMKRHVVIRFNNPATNKTISFYCFDNHGYSVAYALEAKQRGDIPDQQIEHIVVDQHSDSLPALEFEIPEKLSEWNKLTETDYVSMNSFHSVFGRLKMFSGLFWVFDGSADHPSRKQSTADLRKHSQANTVKSLSMSKYPVFKNRPQNSKALVNIDVDTIDQMLGIKEYASIPDYPRAVTPKEALSFYSDFLLQLTKKDSVDIVSFHASTTNWFMRDDGDVESARFLARIAPIIILNSKTATFSELQSIAQQTVEEHSYDLTLGSGLKERLMLRFQTAIKEAFEVDGYDHLIDQAI